VTGAELGKIRVGSWIQEVLSGLDGPRRGKNTKLKLARPRQVISVEFRTKEIISLRVRFRDASIRLVIRENDAHFRLVGAPTPKELSDYASRAEDSPEEFYPGL
jgi:hypothetical protein